MPKVTHQKISETAQSDAPRSNLSTGSSDKKFQFQWYDDFPEWRLWVRPIKDNQIFKEFENISVEKKTLLTALGFEPRSFDCRSTALTN